MKTTIAVVSGAIGILLFAGAVRELKATTDESIPPPDDISCYHNQWTCSNLEGDGYWSGCNPDLDIGVISAAVAGEICTAYHWS